MATPANSAVGTFDWPFARGSGAQQSTLGFGVEDCAILISHQTNPKLSQLVPVRDGNQIHLFAVFRGPLFPSPSGSHQPWPNAGPWPPGACSSRYPMSLGQSSSAAQCRDQNKSGGRCSCCSCRSGNCPVRVNVTWLGFFLSLLFLLYLHLVW